MKKLMHRKKFRAKVIEASKQRPDPGAAKAAQEAEQEKVTAGEAARDLKRQQETIENAKATTEGIEAELTTARASLEGLTGAALEKAESNIVSLQKALKRAKARETEAASRAASLRKLLGSKDEV